MLKSEQTTNLIRMDILRGVLPEGTPLRQSALAHRYGVSTVPIREAIQCLLLEGLATTQPFRGAAVAPLLPERLLGFVRIRIALETEALEQAFLAHTPGSLAKVRVCLEEMATTLGSEAFFEAQRNYLRTLYEPGVYPNLVVEILKIYGFSFRYLAMSPAIFQAMAKDLPMPADIVDALEAGNLPLAQARLRLLYRHTGIICASLLYQQQLETPRVQRRPRGRPRKA